MNLRSSNKQINFSDYNHRIISSPLRKINKTSIPSSYCDLIEYMREQKDKLLTDNLLLDEILDKLDTLLIGAEDMSDLHRDMRVILEAIRIQKDSMISGGEDKLSIDDLIKMSDENCFDQFYLSMIEYSQSTCFADTLRLEEPETKKRKIGQRIIYENGTDEILEPDVLDYIEENDESLTTVFKIQRIVIEHEFIEVFSLITDPNSYSKTIFNAFNLSLSLRMKMVSLKNINGILFVVPFFKSLSGYCHSVLLLTPAQYRCILSKFKISKNLLE